MNERGLFKQSRPDLPGPQFKLQNSNHIIHQSSPRNFLTPNLGTPCFKKNSFSGSNQRNLSSEHERKSNSGFRTLITAKFQAFRERILLNSPNTKAPERKSSERK